MSKKQDEQSAIPQSLLNEINKLSPEKQDAIRFLIQNIDIVEQRSEKDPTFDCHLKEILEKAKSDGDYIFQALLLYKMIKNQSPEPDDKEK